jgi:hypothetical protein
MITLTLQADTIPQMRELLMAALGMERVTAALEEPRPGTPTTAEEASAIANTASAIAKRPVGRPRKVAPEPPPEIDPVDTALEEGFLSNEVDTPEPNGADHDPIALEKLKQETVAKLPDMFAAGKVNLMRAVLTKYGKGAKSFPEIEAKDFPEIAAALQRGDGS